MARITAIGVVLALALVTAPTAAASRPATKGEVSVIEVGFVNAHKHDDGINFSSIREVRISVIDDRWAAVLYRASKGSSKKLSTDFLRAKGADYAKWKPGKPPRPVAADLKRPAEPFRVDIRYQGSGSFKDDLEYDDGFDTISLHATDEFSWDFEWHGVATYDTHYPAHANNPDSATAQGTWTYAYAQSREPSCIASGTLEPTFEGAVLINKGAVRNQLDMTLDEPSYTGTGGCYDRDIFSGVLGASVAKFPVVRDIPAYPTGPVERQVSYDRGCAGVGQTGETCTGGYTGTVTVSPAK